MTNREDDDEIFDEKTFGDTDDTHSSSDKNEPTTTGDDEDAAPFDIYEDDENGLQPTLAKAAPVDIPAEPHTDTTSAVEIPSLPPIEQDIAPDTSIDAGDDTTALNELNASTDDGVAAAVEPSSTEEILPELASMAAGAAAVAAMANHSPSPDHHTATEEAAAPLPPHEPVNVEAVPDEPLKPTNQIPVTLGIELGKMRITAAQLITLQKGNVLPLPVTLSDPITLVANGHPVAKGSLVQVGSVIGVQITQLLEHAH